jgi:hypothetical protein
MYLKLKIRCTCGCSYTSNQDVTAEKIACPNCKLEHPYSDKIISMLKTAKDIPDGSILEGISTSVISFNEEWCSPQ